MFPGECWRCGAEFTSELPQVMCSDDCRTAFAEEIGQTTKRALNAYYREHPRAPRAGDRVRLKTPAEKAATEAARKASAWPRVRPGFLLK